MPTPTEPERYTIEEHLAIRKYLKPYIRARGYNDTPDEKALDKLLSLGVFNLPKVLELISTPKDESNEEAEEEI